MTEMTQTESYRNRREFLVGAGIFALAVLGIPTGCKKKGGSSKNQLPSVTIGSHPSEIIYGQPLALTGSASDPEDGKLDDSKLEWLVNGSVRARGTATLSLTGYDIGSYSITLKATDSNGSKGETNVSISIRDMEYREAVDKRLAQPVIALTAKSDLSRPSEYLAEATELLKDDSYRALLAAYLITGTDDTGTAMSGIFGDTATLDTLMKNWANGTINQSPDDELDIKTGHYGIRFDFSAAQPKVMINTMSLTKEVTHTVTLPETTDIAAMKSSILRPLLEQVYLANDAARMGDSSADKWDGHYKFLTGEQLKQDMFKP
jgi:hypothetical protein